MQLTSEIYSKKGKVAKVTPRPSRPRGLINDPQTDPTNNYSSVGTYDVGLIATDNLGCSDTTLKISYIGIQQMAADFDLAQFL